MHKPYQTSAVLLALAAGLAFSAPYALAGSLKDLGKSLTYPVKKGAHNAGKTVREGAGHASKGVNHTGQAVQYPVQKAGVNTSKTAHKVTQK